MPDPIPALPAWLADPVAAWGDLPPASDHISIVGLVLTLGGLALSVRMAWRAKTAAQMAEQAARDASDDLLRYQDSVRIETAFQKVSQLLDGYSPDGNIHMVPAKLLSLIEDLDRIRVGPHFKDSETGRKIQKFVRDLQSIHSEIRITIGQINNSPNLNKEGGDDYRFKRHHRTLMSLHSYLREREGETNIGEGHGTH